jgi:drug/metabolite transporter (DMT)-like permease
MIWLLLAILSSSVLAIVLKALRTEEPYWMYFSNYITCALLGFFFLQPKSLWQQDPYPLWLGAVSGFVYLAALIAYGYSIRKSGAVLSAVFCRVGVIVPLGISIGLFGEIPSPVQIIGLLIAVAAMVVMNLQPGQKTGSWSLLPLLLVLFLNGLSDSMSKIYTQFGDNEQSDLFLFYIFAFAAVITLILLIIRRQKPQGKALLLGVAVGIPNFLSAKFLLSALTELPAFFVYPIYSVGAIGVIALCSILLFREKLTKMQLMGGSMILLAIVLLNL